MTLSHILLAGAVLVQMAPAKEAMKIAEMGGAAIGFAQSCNFPAKDIQKLSRATGKGIESLKLTDEQKLAAVSLFAEKIEQAKQGNRGEALMPCEQVKRIFYNFPAMKVP